MWLVELLRQSLTTWIENPVAFVGAALIFLTVGYLLSRVRYQGRIDALEERIKGKDDTIALKDQAIQSMSISNDSEVGSLGDEPSVSSGPPMTLRIESGPFTVDQTNSVTNQPTEEKQQFEDVNDRITQKLENRIRKIILNNSFKFVFNPMNGQCKTLTFRADGSIGAGQNQNESRWRIVNGRLEILNSDSDVYSRFILLNDGKSFHHTNDPDTKSIKGQYMTIE